MPKTYALSKIRSIGYICEINSLKFTTNERRYQELFAFLPPCASSEDGLGIRARSSSIFSPNIRRSYFSMSSNLLELVPTQM